ncbi:TAXI family TRAP transporter solute-binding subunit [Gemmobacter serpentinus]|uniref:hypothetical protein n=1 Tax=Gemmobacter serpentinus TaxID=2652247 RepID=UPI00124BDFCC|nr:hypothetical protein [Gemmobacter serpentinus]
MFRLRPVDFLLVLAALIVLTLCLLAPSPVAAQTLDIATGKASGGYDRRAKQIVQRLEQRGIPTTLTNYNGSDEISLALCGGRAGLGILQIDAIYARSLEGCQMKAVGSYGAEAALILFPPRSDYDELSDLGSGTAVLVDTVGSGSDLFWRTITRVETGEDGSGDDWASARVVNDPLELANTSAQMGEIHAVVLVRKPDSPDVQILLGQGWTIGELWDRDINALVFNGAPLYRSAKFMVPTPGGSTVKAWAYEVRSFIAVTRSIADGDRQRFAAVTAAAQ